MKVYIREIGAYADTQVVGVYSSLDAAKKSDKFVTSWELVNYADQKQWMNANRDKGRYAIYYGSTITEWDLV